MNIVQYSKMSNKEILSKGMTTFRDASLFNVNSKEQVDKMRTRLAQHQHDKIKNVDSFKELEKCQMMMFKEGFTMEDKKYKSQFLNEAGLDQNYIITHISNFLKQNNLATLMQAISIALLNCGYKKQAELFKKIVSNKIK